MLPNIVIICRNGSIPQSSLVLLQRLFSTLFHPTIHGALSVLPSSPLQLLLPLLALLGFLYTGHSECASGVPPDSIMTSTDRLYSVLSYSWPC